MRHDVEFPGFAGTTLRGWLYVPETALPAPGVVMAHGFSAVKEMAMDRFAEVFCEAGLTVLAYDHRNLGASDGEPRQEINPWAQARDYRYAIGWLAERAEVDAERIGIWGSSFSGGEVIVVGACDERVRAVVANVPFAALPGVDYQDTEARFEALRAALLDESGAGPADSGPAPTGPFAVVNEAGSELPVFLTFSRSPRSGFSSWAGRRGARGATRSPFATPSARSRRSIRASASVASPPLRCWRSSPRETTSRRRLSRSRPSSARENPSRSR